MKSRPRDVEDALGSLIGALASLGYRPVSSNTSDSFGDFLLRYEKGTKSFAITRDRGQFMVQGEKAELEEADLWRAFSSVAELQGPLLSWLGKR